MAFLSQVLHHRSPAITNKLILTTTTSSSKTALTSNLITKNTNNVTIRTKVTKTKQRRLLKKANPPAVKRLPQNYTDVRNTPIIKSPAGEIFSKPKNARPIIPGIADHLDEPPLPITSSTNSQSTTSTAAADATQQPLLHDMTSLMEEMSPKLRQLFHLTNANSSQRARAQKTAAIKLFQSHPTDTGSSSAQIVALTSRIQQVGAHVRRSRGKDKSGKRGLEALHVRRRKMLDYLERTDFEEYSHVVKTLGLVR